MVGGLKWVKISHVWEGGRKRNAVGVVTRG